MSGAASAIGPNVIVVVIDTARQDAIEPYARSSDTPNCRQLADEGSYHPNVFAPACWTAPSHASLFAGDLPRSIGFDHRGGQSREGYRHALESRKDGLLPEVMRRRGYSTAAISTNPWISPSMGFGEGFDAFVVQRSPRWSHRGEGGLKRRLAWYAQAARAKADDGARSVLGVLEAWLRESQRRPFFWFVNLIECHSPYIPPRQHSAFGPLGRIRVAEDARRYLGITAVARQNLVGGVIPAGAMERMRKQYAGEVAYADGWVGRLREILDRHRVLRDTLIMVVSDHGENFGEGGRFGHAYALNESLIRVPMIWAGPVELEFPRVASLAHVPEAICRAIDIEHGWPVVPGRGEVAVAQFDAPLVADALDPKVMALAGLDPDDDAEAIRRACRSHVVATDGTTKLVRSGSSEEIIDLSTDADETSPTPVSSSSSGADRLSRFRVAIDDAIAAEAGRTIAPSGDGEDDDATRALEEKMQLLGYL